MDQGGKTDDSQNSPGAERFAETQVCGPDAPESAPGVGKPRKDKYLGQILDGYEIAEKIGQGGMGAVYRAADKSLNRQVAIKILPEDALNDGEAVNRFEREAKVLAELNHPNIAQVYRIGRMDGVPFYVMEHIQGRSLAQMLAERGRLAGPSCVRYIVEVAKGLQAAARRGIIHRDIKPANIMITDGGMVKLVDFGIAKAVGDDAFKTSTGQIMGTPTYMSPEQGKGRPVDHRSDIYSLGATFYHLVTGRPPFEADNPLTMMMKHFTEPAPDIKPLNPSVPDSLCNIIYGMMEKNPAERTDDYAQIIVALENACGGEGDRIASCEYASPPGRLLRKMTRGHKLLAAAAAALVLLMAGLTLLRPSGGEDSLFSSPNDAELVKKQWSPGDERRPGWQDMSGIVAGLKSIQDELDQSRPADD
jgi:serine/threonine protein kinase